MSPELLECWLVAHCLVETPIIISLSGFRRASRLRFFIYARTQQLPGSFG